MKQKNIDQRILVRIFHLHLITYYIFFAEDIT
jgi:hypothetical protein